MPAASRPSLEKMISMTVLFTASSMVIPVPLAASGCPTLGFRRHPGSCQFALSPPFHRRTALNPRPCPGPAFWPTDPRCGNPCKSLGDWTDSDQTLPGGSPRNDDTQTLTVHVVFAYYHRHDTPARWSRLASRRVVR